jgi:hypothetical protein
MDMSMDMIGIGAGIIGGTSAMDMAKFVPANTFGILLTTMKMEGTIPDTGVLNRERVTCGRPTSFSRNFTSCLGSYSGMDFCGNHYSGGRSLGYIANNASP